MSQVFSTHLLTQNQRPMSSLGAERALRGALSERDFCHFPAQGLEPRGPAAEGGLPLLLARTWLGETVGLRQRGIFTLMGRKEGVI